MWKIFLGQRKKGFSIVVRLENTHAVGTMVLQAKIPTPTVGLRLSSRKTFSFHMTFQQRVRLVTLHIKSYAGGDLHDQIVLQESSRRRPRVLNNRSQVTQPMSLVLMFPSGFPSTYLLLFYVSFPLLPLYQAADIYH